MMRGRHKASDEGNKRKHYSTFYSNVRIVSFDKEEKEKIYIEREHLVQRRNQKNC